MSTFDKIRHLINDNRALTRSQALIQKPLKPLLEDLARDAVFPVKPAPPPEPTFKPTTDEVRVANLVFEQLLSLRELGINFSMKDAVTKAILRGLRLADEQSATNRAIEATNRLWKKAVKKGNLPSDLKARKFVPSLVKRKKNK